MNNVSKTIGWAQYTINPIKGLCKHACWYCYARRMYKRFKWNEEVRLDLSVLDNIAKIKEPSRIFLCSTHDLFGEWIPDKWIFDIMTELHRYPQHTFLLLTKNPARYKDWTFKDNFWCGATITNEEEARNKMPSLMINANRFVSCEPLLGDVHRIQNYPVHWYIIGGLTGSGKKYKPEKEWIEEILRIVDREKRPVFMKNNLKPYWKGEWRQEFPKDL